jgi:MFS family permease
MTVHRHAHLRKNLWQIILPARYPRPLVISGWTAFFGYSSFNLLLAALPLYYTQTLGYSIEQVGALVGIGFLLDFLAYLLVGSFADRFGSARYILWSAAALALTAPLFALSHTLWLLIGIVLMRGFIMSTFALLLNTLAGTLTSPEQRGAHMGFYGLFSNVASALAPAVGVFVFKTTGPPALFLCALISGLLAVVLSLLLYKERSGSVSSQFSLSLWTWLSGSRQLLVPACAMIAMGLAYGVVLAFMPNLLVGRSIQNPGFFYTAEVVPQLLLRTVAGKLSDRYGRAAVSGIGLFLMGVSVFAIIFIHNDVETILVGLMAGAGWAATGPVIIAWMLDLTGANQRGLASATYFAAQDIGRILGSLVLGYSVLSLGAAAPFTIASALTGAVACVLLILAPTRRRYK